MLNRREFLATTAAAAAATAGLGLPAYAAKGEKMRLGLVTYLWGEHWDLDTLIKNCSAAGLLGAEFRTTHAHGVEPSLSVTEREEIKKRLEDSPMEWWGIGSNENYDSPDRMKLQKAIAVTQSFVRLSHDIGGTGVKVKPNSFHDGVPHEETIEQIGRTLHLLGAYGKEFGQEIRLEVHGQCSELPTIAKIMEYAQHPNVGVCWNSNDVDLEGDGLEHNFNLVKDRFGDTAHIRELNVGDYPYQDLINLFVQMDYDGWVLLEARTDPEDPIAAMKEQLQLFNDMIANAQNA